MNRLAKSTFLLGLAQDTSVGGGLSGWAVLGSGNNATIYNLDLELGTERHR